MTAKQAFATMLANLVGSRKWMFSLVVIAAATVLAVKGVLTKQEWQTLIEWIGGPLLLATGVEKIGSPTPATPTASVPPGALVVGNTVTETKGPKS